ncbi:serine dehydratase beta chain [Mycobacteroides abscessus]|uniref:serine dehydratase beta chain n=1 Tax=Mycobacteroides abscessus TaxID=36809 RepID=UPI0013F69538
MHSDKRARVHANTMKWTAIGPQERVLSQRTFYSIGGRSVVEECQGSDSTDPTPVVAEHGARVCDVVGPVAELSGAARANRRLV